MPTLVLPPRYTTDSVALWKAAIGAGWNVERLANWRPPESLAGEEIVLYGEPLFAAVVAAPLGIALLEPPLSWTADLPASCRGRSVRVARLDDARALRDPAFVKPADDKCFLARVYATGAELPAADLLDGSITVLIAEPVVWEIEFRCFVLQRQVTTWSPYPRHGQTLQSDDRNWTATEEEIREALAFVERVLRDERVLLPPAIVVDVGKIAGRGWAVVEANAAWGSGIYGCDPREVLRVIQRACVPLDQLTEVDRPWIVERV